MRNKVKILLILITLLAAFMSEVKVDSPLICMEENTSDSSVISQIETKVNAVICTAEMLGIHGGLEECRLIIGHVGRRGDERITLFMLSVFAIMLLAGSFRGAMERITVRGCFSKELITIYMHKSDGKKRI